MLMSPAQSENIMPYTTARAFGSFPSFETWKLKAIPVSSDKESCLLLEASEDSEPAFSGAAAIKRMGFAPRFFFLWLLAFLDLVVLAPVLSVLPSAAAGISDSASVATQILLKNFFIPQLLLLITPPPPSHRYHCGGEPLSQAPSRRFTHWIQ